MAVVAVERGDQVELDLVGQRDRALQVSALGVVARAAHAVEVALPRLAVEVAREIVRHHAFGEVELGLIQLLQSPGAQSTAQIRTRVPPFMHIERKLKSTCTDVKDFSGLSLCSFFLGCHFSPPVMDMVYSFTGISGVFEFREPLFPRE